MRQRIILVGNVSAIGPEIEQIIEVVPDLMVDGLVTDNADTVLALLPNGDRVRVVVIDDDDHLLYVYDKDQVSVARIEDLIAVIQG